MGQESNMDDLLMGLSAEAFSCMTRILCGVMIGATAEHMNENISMKDSQKVIEDVMDKTWREDEWIPRFMTFMLAEIERQTGQDIMFHKVVQLDIEEEEQHV